MLRLILLGRSGAESRASDTELREGPAVRAAGALGR